MGLLDILRPEPRCQHNNVRGHCTKCAGQTRERFPTGEFRGRSGGRLVPKSKGKHRR